MFNKPLIRIVDDDDALRDALLYTVESEGWEAAAYPDAASFLAGDLPSRTGALILDVRMPGMSGMELYKELEARKYPVPVIFLTAHGDIDMAVAALRSGAFHFLQKPVSRDTLLGAIREALGREDERRAKEAAERLARLTDREREVAQMLNEGSTNREIASELGLSVRTVENHRATIYRKLLVGTVEEIRRILDLSA